MRFGRAVHFAALAGVSLSSLFGLTKSFSPSVTFTRGKTTTVLTKQHDSGCLSTACAGAVHALGCTCSSCTGFHETGCTCGACARSQRTRLYADVTTEAETEAEPAPEAAAEPEAVTEPELEAETEAEIPAEVEAMDGVDSPEEAHNVERPARESIRRKRAPRGKPLSEFEVGTTVSATVKSVTSYGAFCDFGGTSDGLLHISRMSMDYVQDVNSIVKAGDKVDVRILEIDSKKNQVALTLLTVEEEEDAAAAQAEQRERRGQRQQQRGGRRDDKAVLNKLDEAGFDSEKFVAGKVVSTVAFGAFVRVNAADVNEEVEGSFDGLVHISALQAGRTESVTDIVNVDDEVQVRVKAIGDGKVSLSMVSVEAEAAAAAERAASFGAADEPEPESSANWQQEMGDLQSNERSFKNGPLVVDSRN